MPDTLGGIKGPSGSAGLLKSMSPATEAWLGASAVPKRCRCSQASLCTPWALCCGESDPAWLPIPCHVLSLLELPGASPFSRVGPLLRWLIPCLIPAAQPDAQIPLLLLRAPHLAHGKMSRQP